MAGGSKQQFDTMAKPLHAGLAAKNGIVAAHLAQSGIEAALDNFALNLRSPPWISTIIAEFSIPAG